MAVDIIGRVKGAIASAIFPRMCLRCGVEGVLLCRWCSGSVDFGALPFAYANPIVRELLRSWKYFGDETARDILFGKAAAAWGNPIIKTDVIVPVPLSGRRLRDRGFNQADEIAMWVSARIDVPVARVLKRRETWGQQAKRAKELRGAAMENSPFVIEEELKGNVLLVDDVITTGATIEAARRVLLAAGANTVEHFTLIAGGP